MERNRRIELLTLLTHCPIWDDNITLQTDLEALIEHGLAVKHLGWNILTVKGIEYCVVLKLL